MKLTPVLIADSIEKGMTFWVDRMGFEKTVEVPEGDRIGFVILNSGPVELMIQSAESVRKDIPAFAPAGQAAAATLFIEVDDFADTVKRLAGYPLAMEERTTF